MTLKHIIVRYGLALFVFGILLLVVLSLVDIKLPGKLLDKLVHFLAYFTLASLAFRLWPDSRRIRLAAVLLFMLGVGVELAQMFVDARYASVRDLASNAAGILAAYAARPLLKRPAQTARTGNGLAGRCASRG